MTDDMNEYWALISLLNDNLVPAFEEETGTTSEDPNRVEKYRAWLEARFPGK